MEYITHVIDKIINTEGLFEIIKNQIQELMD